MPSVLADTYLRAASSLASIAANHVATHSGNEDLAMTPETWQERLELQQRFKLYSSRALAAIAYAQLAAADIPDAQERSSNMAFLEEQKGSLLLEQIQDAPPMYDQMNQTPDRHSAVYQQACTAGLEAFQRAQLILPAEWTFQLCIAKMLRKLHKQPGQVLHHLANACMLAKQMVGGSVEAMYQLHAMRLKLLQEEQPDLHLLGRHCFSPETLPALLLVNSAQERPQLVRISASFVTLSASASSSQSSDAVDLIYEDAMSAMDFCLEQSKQHSRNGSYETFHKAHYRKGQALRWKGQHEQALAELQPFFKGKAKHGFVINMFIIPDGVKKAAKVPLLAPTLIVCILAHLHILSSNECCFVSFTTSCSDISFTGYPMASWLYYVMSCSIDCLLACLQAVLVNKMLHVVTLLNCMMHKCS